MIKLVLGMAIGLWATLYESWFYVAIGVGLMASAIWDVKTMRTRIRVHPKPHWLFGVDLFDRTSMTILSVLDKVALSATEIQKSTKLPIAPIYRRLGLLLDFKLIEVQRIERNQEGSRETRFYVSCVERFSVAYEKGIMSVEIWMREFK